MKIKFYYHAANNDLFAVIRENKHSVLSVSYSHIGQHSAIHSDYIKESRKLNRNNKVVQPLLKELKSIGYNL